MQKVMLLINDKFQNIHIFKALNQNISMGGGELREAIIVKKSQNCGLFPYGGGGSIPFHSFRGCFP